MLVIFQYINYKYLVLFSTSNIKSQIAAEAAADQDITVTAGLGNGGTGSTVYRLREGIERFLITDINNPAASAQAQSTVWIMGATG